MKISELFRRDIHRTIEEVVKVDLADEAIIAGELDEYVATGHILEEFEKVLDAYQESINVPNETCSIWVSGFFGSGKSSWAKVLGYVLWDPAIDGRSATERFFARTHAPSMQALLNTIHTQAPTLTVLLNLATGSNVVAREGESVVLPAYRALLERLDYSRNFLLAELEFTLEGDGQLEAFETRFREATGKEWKERRYTSFAKNEASMALNLMDPGRFSQPDSWARSVTPPEINADWFAMRVLELLGRRAPGVGRIAFVVDEAGQYVARSVQRMLDLQGLAEAFQKRMGRLWLVVTSQERLNDVVDSLESAQVELARAQSRFPLRVDLLPSDIDEVTGKRVLDKTEAGQQAVRDVIAPQRHQLATNTRLTSPTRAADAGEDELVRLYPLLPYQVQLLIDAVSARRAQGGASPTVGGSNRTIIKHTQQLVIHPQHGLGEEEVGALVTLDRSYDLLEELIPTSWRAEVEQVVSQYGAESAEAKVIKVVALCVEVPALPLTAENIAVLLHASVRGESVRDEVAAALGRLVDDNRLRETGDGYKLQSPEQRDWELARRGVDLTQGPSVRLRRLLLRQALSGLSVTKGRTFKVQVVVDGEEVVDGQLPLQIEEADESRQEALRAVTREAANENKVIWTYQLSGDSWDLLVELHRSRTMIERRDTPNKSAAEVELLGEERERERRLEASALQRLTADLTTGQVMFRGRVEEAGDGDVRTLAQNLMLARLDEMYAQLSQFTASLRRDDVLLVLRTSDLGSLPAALRDDGIALVRAAPGGYEFVADVGPLALLVAEVRRRAAYGQEATGSHLEGHFAAPPYGAPIEVVEALCAAGIRTGLLEVIHQGQRISNAGDGRLDQVFGTTPRFRAAAFRPPADSDVPLERRVELAGKLEELIGPLPAGHSTDALANAVRGAFLARREGTIRVAATLTGLGITVPESVARTRVILDRLSDDDDVNVVTTAAETWADLVAGNAEVSRLDGLLQSDMDTLRAAQRESHLSSADLTEDLEEQHQELCDLLRSGDFADHMARLAAIVTGLNDARAEAVQRSAIRLKQSVEESSAALRDAFADLDEAVLVEALRPIESLDPPEELGDLDAGTLDAQVDSVRSRVEVAARQLEELRAAGQLSWVRVTDLVSEPIGSEEELDAAVNRIRDAVATELSEGKRVRLQ